MNILAVQIQPLMYAPLKSYFLTKKLNRARVSEVVDNDCFIGTMGCNEYKKGLRLNKRRCKK